MTKDALFETIAQLDKETAKLTAIRDLEITAISLKSQLKALERNVYPSPQIYEAIDDIIEDAAYFGKYADETAKIWQKRINILRGKTTNG
jgi:hypothetical protein